MVEIQNRTLQKSIWGLVLIYYLGESVVFFVIGRIYGFSQVFFLLFLGAGALFCILVGMFLIINKHLFHNNAGEVLSSVNLACKITLFRIIMIPFVIFLIIALKNFQVGPVLAFSIGLTCLSDLFDGIISRRYNQETFMGKILDSSSDYLLLGVVSIAYYLNQLLPPWLFWLLISRLLLHSLGMMVLYLLRRKLIPQTTTFGKIAVASCMILFIFMPVALVFPALERAIKFIEICTGILIFISLVDKGIFFIRGLTLNLAEREGRSVK